MNNKGYWYNYRTEEYEHIITPDDYRDYIPQIPAAISAYEIHQELGKSPQEAALAVLLMCVEDE